MFNTNFIQHEFLEQVLLTDHIEALNKGCMGMTHEKVLMAHENARKHTKNISIFKNIMKVFSYVFYFKEYNLKPHFSYQNF